MAVKIRLLRMGKIRNPQYRIVVADSRTKRDGRAIEFVGIYQPKEDPSVIEVNSDRVQYWLSVGAQPSEAVQRLLEKTGDWQKFKGLPAPPPLLVAPRSGPTARRSTRPRRRPRPAWPRLRPSRRRRRPSRGEGRQGREGRGPRCRGCPRPRPPPPRSRPVRTPASRPDMALRPALEHLVKGIVDNPDDVRVRMVDSRRGKRLEVRVHPEDLGTVIGAVRTDRQGAASGRSAPSAAGACASTSLTRTDAPGRRPDRQAARDPRRGHRGGADR